MLLCFLSVTNQSETFRIVGGIVLVLAAVAGTVFGLRGGERLRESLGGEQSQTSPTNAQRHRQRRFVTMGVLCAMAVVCACCALRLSERHGQQKQVMALVQVSVVCFGMTGLLLFVEGRQRRERLREWLVNTSRGRMFVRVILLVTGLSSLAWLIAMLIRRS